MAPRIPFLAALRQPSRLLRLQTAGIATTKPSKILHKDIPAASSALIDIGDSLSAAAGAGAQQQSSTAGALRMYDQLRNSVERRMALEDALRSQDQSDDFSRQLPRRWRSGDVYAPHDLSPSEMAKWRRNQARKRDLVDMLGINPLDMYRNFSVISEFMTEHGRIKRSADTGLRPKNQRKMAKAVRRAIGLGIHPSVHRHPELLIREHFRMQAQNMATVNKDLRY
ncbi:ribosomal protein S18 [Durotheca rogersii]|uniref:ribosomal protein S18 n=1 Tax=Durotheca rogersii TaxID=419775 RepID=UPI002220C832|nr:ribosomal protein S18 [Durotheca rogersii]KAI5861180.1 ribosomal protein S18 [Durotheca rogersii]